LGLVALAVGMPGNISNKFWMISTAAPAGYLGSLIVFCFPKLPFRIRAAIICASIYSLGAAIILDVGPFLASREWLFSFSIITAIFLGWPGAILSISVNLITWFLVGILIHIGFWGNRLHVEEPLLYWSLITIDLLFINVATTLLISLFFLRLTNSDRSARTYSQLLLSEGRKLSQTNVQLAAEIEDRKSMARALRESEEKYRTILETIEDAYFEVNLKGELTFFNKYLRERTGYPAAQLMGMNYRRFIDKKDIPKLFQVFGKVFSSGKTSPLVDLDVISRDNVAITVSLLVSLVTDSSGKPIGFRGLARDITEHRAMENRLRHAQKMEAVGTLAGGVAHDLNNTLAGVISYPEMLLLDMPESSVLRKPILAIKKSGEKAVAIVQDLLTLARRGVAVKEVVNINTIVREYLLSPEFHSLQSFHPGVLIETDLDPTLGDIIGSPVHLSKTLMNLISNAAEAIRDEGKVLISTRNQSTEGILDVVLTIRDTGEGIDPKDREKIFEPFFTKKTMGRSGTGLGMAVVWGTVEDHGGRIDVQSTVGKGTTFTIRFPATREKKAEAKKTLSIDQYKGHGESILVVDDLESQREIATAMLTLMGYKVTSIASGEEAVAYLRTHTADLLLLDMIMRPGIDGLETFKRVIAFRPDQRAIIASGFSETERVGEAQRLGAGRYLRKPYSLQSLGTAVKEELRVPRRQFN
jgi:PAS domain S-box-containing protein